MQRVAQFCQWQPRLADTFANVTHALYVYFLKYVNAQYEGSTKMPSLGLPPTAFRPLTMTFDR